MSSTNKDANEDEGAEVAPKKCQCLIMWYFKQIGSTSFAHFIA